jgi:hypothetical protein
MEGSRSNKYDVYVSTIKYGTWLIFFGILVYLLSPIKTVLEDKLPCLLDNTDSIEAGGFKFKFQGELKKLGFDNVSSDLRKLSKEQIKYLLNFGDRNWAISIFAEQTLHIQITDKHEIIKSLVDVGVLSTTQDLEQFLQKIESLGFKRSGGSEGNWQYTTLKPLSPDQEKDLNSLQVKLTDAGKKLTSTIIDVVTDELKDEAKRSNCR